jgi:O-acetyl-ADP-ribose deacetylase (regulator of RNase III)
VWRDGQSGEPELLARCYKNSLALAVRHALRTIAFPGISTGVYGYPFHRAADIALREIRTFLSSDNSLERVVIVCFSRDQYEWYLMHGIGGTSGTEQANRA